MLATQEFSLFLLILSKPQNQVIKGFSRKEKRMKNFIFRFLSFTFHSKMNLLSFLFSLLSHLYVHSQNT